jgi:small subunit ribosomal protein S26e
MRCSNCSRCVPKDKAIKRFTVRNMVESAAVRDISDASVYPGKSSSSAHRFYDLKHGYRICHSKAVHQNCILRVLCYPLTWQVTSHVDIQPYLTSFPVVRVRSREGRRNRAPPPRIRWKDGKKVNPAVAAAEDAKAAAGAAKA